ncbi:MAG: nucleotidyltransferase [Candidatus Fischerbacteria bacterium RBG_13_37_8]|uniref:Nucleotidyltransferase n=1 Tax=Candidatus Fischerbacteria bacterium RBG_13_37_8 TaxID=1817863 RepID=A0A1F5VXF9_9BACT|nr:MAG: nucleotidyltransferase [Candidatus Fischerbacteria bacterium RBG_13_37_8]
MNLAYAKKILLQHKEELEKKFHIIEIGIFGSYVRGEQKKKSDLDVLVEFVEDSHISLLEYIRLQNLLSDILGVKVDLVEKKCLKPHIGKRILEEVIYL